MLLSPNVCIDYKKITYFPNNHQTWSKKLAHEEVVLTKFNECRAKFRDFFRFTLQKLNFPCFWRLKQINLHHVFFFPEHLIPKAFLIDMGQCQNDSRDSLYIALCMFILILVQISMQMDVEFHSVSDETQQIFASQMMILKA